MDRATMRSDSPNPLLLVEDDPSLREALCATLALEDIAFEAVESAEAALEAVQEHEWSVVISDIRLPGASGLKLLAQARHLRPQLPVVLMTAYADAQTAVEALKGGARDFLMKPFTAEQFVDVAKRYLLDPTPGHSDPDGPVAVDPLTRQLMSKLDRVAQTDATVLLSGESGSGKEIMAQYVHRKSKRAGQAFVAINCAAIPSSLLEATLFGHEKGAFTGATKSQVGKFELAQRGTLFLDELGEMPLELQAKLLRVLQERQVERVGSHQTIALDVRVIAATNQDLIKRVSQGLFREDLYYRINVFPLKIPALRERCADILPLAERFLLKYRASMGQPEARLSETTRRLLGQYPWPGNVRELENAIQRGLLLCDGHWIEPQDMALDHHALATDAIHDSKTPAARSMTATASHAEPERTAIQERRLTSSAVTEDASATATASAIELPLPTTASGRSTMQPLGTDVDESGAATGGIRALEREHILKVLHQVGGSRKRAVEILGISERTLRYKLKLWRESGIQVP
jgi:two-component system response regulator FlrC